MELPNDLKDYEAEEPGFLGLLRDTFNAVLAAFAILFLIVVALGWS